MNEGTGRVRIEESKSGLAVVREERSGAFRAKRRAANKVKRSRRLRRATGGSQGQSTWMGKAKAQTFFRRNPDREM